MAALRVKPLGEIRDCGLGLRRSDGDRRRRVGLVSYSRGGGAAAAVNCPRLIVFNSADLDCGVSSSSSSSASSSWFHGRRDRDSSSSSSSYTLESLATELRRSYDRQRRDESVDVDIASKLDLWVKESVGEIMSDIEEAPFLVHVYSDSEGEDSTSTSAGKTRFVREKASADSWPEIKGRWGGANPTPNGIILVEEMKNDEQEQDSSCSSTRVWGILIQGKGLSVPACYILKTCRIRSVLGSCTHFCLVRVECFFESVDTQLKKLWLV